MLIIHKAGGGQGLMIERWELTMDIAERGSVRLLLYMQDLKTHHPRCASVISFARGITGAGYGIRRKRMLVTLVQKRDRTRRRVHSGVRLISLVGSSSTGRYQFLVVRWFIESIHGGGNARFSNSKGARGRASALR